MTPKEKAKDLFDSFWPGILPDAIEIHFDIVRKCALLAVKIRLDAPFKFVGIEHGDESLEYWEQVKSEIEKL